MVNEEEIESLPDEPSSIQQDSAEHQPTAPIQIRSSPIRSTILLLIAPILCAFLIAIAPRFDAVNPLVHKFLSNSGLAKVHVQPLKFPKPPYILFSSKVLLPSGTICPAYISVAPSGKIARIQPSLVGSLFVSNIVDVSPLLIMPGLIDPHVHINSPGRDSWEGFDAASRAAAAGGTTTILDMPLNNIPATVNKNALAKKVKALATSHSLVDVGLIGGIIPDNLDNFGELVEAGVIAVKSFMVNSQSPDFPHVTPSNLERAIEKLGEFVQAAKPGARRIPYILHAELEEETNSVEIDWSSYDHTSYADYEKSRPSSWETQAVNTAIKAANNSLVHIHIAHVSSHEVVQIIESAHSGTLKNAILTAETCPHYLLWEVEQIPSHATLFKCSPPIRSAANRQKMLNAVLVDSSHIPAVSMIVSDHSPCPGELKGSTGNFSEAWGGISGLQYRLQGTWTVAKRLNIGIAKVSNLLSSAAARVFGLANLKGSIKPGFDADFVIWNPDEEQELSVDECLHRHKGSAFHGMKLNGLVHYTVLRGELVFARDPNVRNSSRYQFGDVKGKLLTRSSKSGIVSALDPAVWQA